MKKKKVNKRRKKGRGGRKKRGVGEGGRKEGKKNEVSFFLPLGFW